MRKLWLQTRQLFKSYRAFIVVTMLTAVVWLLVSLSEVRNFTIKVPVGYVGYNDAQYAVTYVDTSLYLNVDMNGFEAVARKFRHSKQGITIDVSSDVRLSKAIGVAAVLDTIAPQLKIRANRQISSAKDSLRLVLKPLMYKPFCPDLSKVDFKFADQYGLNGAPIVSPDTVFLYGSEESLSKITGLQLQPATFTNITDSDTYELLLEPVWEQFDDVRPSVDRVKVFVPISSFTELTIEIPIVINGADSSLNVKLYPSQVVATVWVPQSDYSNISPSMFAAEVDQKEIQSGKETLPVRLSKFPSMTRIKSINPSEIQYIVIK